MMDRFDVFLCHNSQDKPEVITIAQRLKQKGLKPWLDKWELRPGLSWQELLEQQIKQVKSAAVFVGRSGLGPWQESEMRAFLSEFVNRKCPVIPVLLSSAPKQPELPIFLKRMTWVDFRCSESDPIEQFIWGITGVKPGDQSVHNERAASLSSFDPGLLSFKMPPSVQSQAKAVELKSGKGIDYTRLRDLLAAGRWEDADWETTKVIFQGEEERFLWAQFTSLPCEDFRTINQLWLYYSEGKFGFSVQKEVYESLGGRRKFDTVVPTAFERFGYRVGWKDAPEGLTESEYLMDLFASQQSLSRHMPIEKYHRWRRNVERGYKTLHSYVIAPIISRSGRLCRIRSIQCI